MYDQGARLRTFGCMAKGIVDEIVREHIRSKQASASPAKPTLSF